MASSRNLKTTNEVMNNDGATHLKSSTSQIDDRLATKIEMQELNRRVAVLEQLFNDRSQQENVQIKKLQDQVRELEEQVSQQAIRIKQLQGLQDTTPKQNTMDRIASASDKENAPEHSKTSQPLNLNTTDQVNSDAEVPITIATNGGNQREDKKQPDASAGANSSVVPKATPNSTGQFRPGAAIREMSSTDRILQGRRNMGRPLVSNDDRFARWMDSSEDDHSLWLNEKYRGSLLSYIGNKFGQKNNIRRVLEPLRIAATRSSELDKLHSIVETLAKQRGAKESLQEWQSDSRPTRRLFEVKTMFEFNSASLSNLGGLILTPSDLEEIINRDSIKAYFDLICRNGATTTEIGEYLHLSKGNIFGGDVDDCRNSRMTFVPTDLEKSQINLDDNRVDLVTCLVTLHHVPHLNSMLRELVRILRPQGYLILREPNCKNEHSLTAKYLNFVHAFMMIAEVGEFARSTPNCPSHQQVQCLNDTGSKQNDWGRQKSAILECTKLIQYRTHNEWKKELESVGFRLKATLDYNITERSNPQELFYAVYQLVTK